MSFVFTLLISAQLYAHDDLRGWVEHVKSVTLKSDQDYLTAQNELEAARSANRQAIFEFAPSVSYVASVDDDDKHVAHSLTASVNLFNGLQDYREKSKASFELREKLSDLARVELQTEVNVARRSVRWLDLLMREEVLKKEVQSRQVSLDIMKKRYKRGIVAEDEVLKLQVDSLGSEVELRGLQVLLKNELNNFFRDFDVKLSLLKVRQLPEPSFDKVMLATQVPVSKTKEFPKVKASYFSWMAAKAEYQRAQGALYSPSIDGSYVYKNTPSSSSPYTYNGTAGVTLTMPIFSQLEDLNDEIQARLSADTARLVYENEVQVSETLYKNRVAELAKLKESYELQKKAVELADKFYSQSVRRFRLGVGDSNNMAFDLQRLTRAKLGLSRLKKEIYEAALDLNALTGQAIIDVF